MSDLARHARRSSGIRPPSEDGEGKRTPLFGLWLDLRHASRLIRRSPAFSAAIVGVLALAIGAVAAVWSVGRAVLLQPLPYPDQDQLVVLRKLDAAGRDGQLSSADWLDYSSRVAAFDGMTAYANWTHNLVGDGEPLRLRSVITTGNFFHVLRSQPALGRVYGDADDQPGVSTVVVLSAGLWTRRFGGDPLVVGRTITLNGRAATVIGVMPHHFAFPSGDVDLWMPIAMGPELKADRASEWLRTVARLSSGTARAAAFEEARATAAALAREFPATNSGEQITLVPIEDEVFGDVRPAILAVAFAVTFAFLVSCLSVVNLLVSRASTRREEMLVRYALGASAWRVTRQALIENTVLVAASALLGLAFGDGLLRGLLAIGSTRIPRLQDAGLAGVISGAAAASGAVLAVCGTTSVLSLINSHRLTTSGARVTRAPAIRQLLLAAQIALSFVLVASSILLAGSYLRLQDVSPGFDGHNVLSLRVTLPRAKYPDSASHTRFVEAVERELASVPAVESAGAVNDLPFAGNQMSFAITWEGGVFDKQQSLRATVRLTDPGYFTTLRVPLVAGRSISEDDTAGRELVMLVNQSAADHYFAGDAIGRRMRVGESLDWRRVVGIVGDTRHAGLQVDEGPVLYLPYAQKPFDFINWVGFLVRARDVGALAGTLKARVAAVDSTQPLYDVLLVEDYMARAQAPYRLNAWIVGGLAAISLFLAAAGVFALANYNVTAAGKELAVRVALGASPATMLGLVFRQVLTLLLVGTLSGVVGAILATRLLASLLFEMTPTDPRLYATVAIVLVGCGLIAALPPAIRAAHADPLTTLKAE